MRNKIRSLLLCVSLLLALFTTGVTADKTLSVTYDANGGTVSGGTAYTVGGITGTVAAVTELEPVRRNYTFTGWSTDPDAEAPSYSSSGGVGLSSKLTLTGDMTLYAVWTPQVRSVSISSRITQISQGETVTLTAAALTTTGEAASVVWHSSDPATAAVNRLTGEVLGISKGTCTIYAGAASDEELFDSVKITVFSDSDADITTISRELWAGDSFTLSSSGLGSRVTWYSCDERIAVVNDSGKLTGAGAGSTVVIGSGSSGTLVCNVTVCAGVYLDPGEGEFPSGAAFIRDTIFTQTYVIPKEIPELEGSTFLGWSEIEDDTAARYLPGDEVPVGSELELFAVWEKEPPEYWIDEADTSWYQGEKGTYIVSTPEELAGLAWLVDRGNSFYGKTIQLGADIELNGSDDACRWIPIGEDCAFSGTLDGCGHTISGLYVETTKTDSGLFGCLKNATVRNLIVSGVVICDNVRLDAGAIAGYAVDSEFFNCASQTAVSGEGACGGLVGCGEGCLAENCWFAGSVSSGTEAGALFGNASGCTISSCYWKKTGTLAALGTSDDCETETQALTAEVMRSADFVDDLNRWVEENAVGLYPKWEKSSDYPVFPENAQPYESGDTQWYKAGETEFTVGTYDELRGLYSLVEDGVSFRGCTVTLSADITMSGAWTPIGTQSKPFSGTFDGAGYSIKGIDCTAVDGLCGLFGVLNGAEVRNLEVSGTFLCTQGSESCGSIAAKAVNSTVWNCCSLAECTGAAGTGGLIGRMSGSTLKNCWYGGKVIGSEAAVIAGAVDYSTLEACSYLSYGTDTAACGSVSSDSTTACAALSATDLKKTSFSDSLNGWVSEQNKDIFCTWTQTEGEFPVLSTRLAPIQSLTVTPASATIRPGEEKALTATVLPNTATFSNVVWTSSEPTVASISASGVVTGLKEGTTVITALVGGKSAVCRLTVERPADLALGQEDYELVFNFPDSIDSTTLSAMLNAQSLTAGYGAAFLKAVGFTAGSAAEPDPDEILTGENADALICAYVGSGSGLSGQGTVTTGDFLKGLLRAVGTTAQSGQTPPQELVRLFNDTYLWIRPTSTADTAHAASGAYTVDAALLSGAAAVGLEIHADLLPVVETVTDLSEGKEFSDCTFSARNVSDEYAENPTILAITLSGMTNEAITTLRLSADELTVGSEIEIICFAESGKYAAKPFTVKEDGLVTFNTKIFGTFILTPAETYSAEDWDRMTRFRTDTPYTGFSDVNEALWYGTEQQGVIQSVVSLGIMNGYTDGTFLPEADIKLSEAVKMAAVVRSIYCGDGYEFDMTVGDHWYDVYTTYAIEKGIIKAGEYSDYERPATRLEMARIFANALPSLDAINNLTGAYIPDLDETGAYADVIVSLYNAGILTGDAGTHAFRPNDGVTRGEAAAIITRICLKSERVALS